MTLAAVKLLHLGCALLTFLLFSLRGLWMLGDSPLLGRRVVKIAPHIIDSLLLLTGLVLAIRFYGAFYTQPWLLVKLLGVVLYIIVGSVALKYGRTKRIRGAALLLALLIFVFIVLVALSHSPLPYL